MKIKPTYKGWAIRKGTGGGFIAERHGVTMRCHYYLTLLAMIDFKVSQQQPKLSLNDSSCA